MVKELIKPFGLQREPFEGVIINYDLETQGLVTISYQSSEFADGCFMQYFKIEPTAEAIMLLDKIDAEWAS